jgi:hypothetical protein
MENNSLYNNQKVYVEADYDNIVVVDPNKMVEPDGKVVERLFNPEELVVYANLDAKIIPRTKLALGNNYDDTVQNLRVGAIDGDIDSKVNFMRPKGKDYFDTSWTDQLTGDGSLTGDGINQTKVTWSKNDINGNETQFIQRRSTTNQEDTQLLGIDRISIKLNTSYVPVVTIEMTDIQGRMLFEQGENSPYSAFMQMPYPLFNLTIKGYFGKAIRYELMLKNFNARLDSSDGNYKITTQYIARTYAILSDIQIESLFSLPRMYPSSTIIGSEKNKSIESLSNGDGGTSRIRTINSSVGREKISEVYMSYKDKGLIDPDFPDMSLNEMLYKLNNFERYVMKSYGSEDMTAITDIEKYRALLKEYRNRIYGPITDNWYSKYIDPSRTLVLNDVENTIIHRFKLELENGQIIQAKEELKKLVTQYNDKLNNNTTFGSGGKLKVNGKEIDSSVNCNIKYNNFIKILDNVDDINIEKSWRKTKGSNPTSVQLDRYKSNLYNEFKVGEVELNNNTGEIQENVLFKTCIIFGEKLPNESKLFDRTFLGKLAKIEEKFDEKRSIVEEELSTSLANKIRSEDIGLGFNPTIKNVLAVICASADGFFRLMDKVHEDAWEQRKNPVRLSSVTGNDNKDNVETISEDGLLMNEKIVYPWPQYLELKTDKKGNEEFVNMYPGDSSVASKTQAFDSNTWPEVKFVEEFIRATLEKEGEENVSAITQDKGIKFIYSSAIEFPFTETPYTNLTEISFLYELYERTLLAATTNKYVRENDYQDEMYEVIGDMEFLNVNESVKDSPGLMMKLKQYGFSYENMEQLLFNASKLGSWNTYIRDEYVTNYIKGYGKTSTGLYNVEVIDGGDKDIENATNSIKKLETHLNSTKTNEYSFLDGYPFNNIEWLNENVSNGEGLLNSIDANKTINTFNVLNDIKVIASFSEEDDEFTNKFFTNFNWVNNTNIPSEVNSAGDGEVPDIAQSTLLSARLFYENRGESQMYLTESLLNYGENYNEETNNLISAQTTSLLNTPYFINSIMSGVDKEKNDIENPYTQMGYLYLNSLPLSNVSEKIKTYKDGATFNKDYIFSVINKYSAIHRQTYLWFLKCGSIWYRYKKYHEQGLDILDEVWKDFDYEGAYDPNGGDYTKHYNIINSEGQNEIYQGLFIDEVYESESVGMYPKLINDIYYYFTEVSVFDQYSDDEFVSAYNDKKLNIVRNNSEFLFKPIGYDIENVDKAFSQNTWLPYFNIKGNTDFLDYDKDKVLIIPSTGSRRFNQFKYECFNELGNKIQDVFSNKSVHNGAVRILWESPNYGYFNNDMITKPKHYEYIKNVKSDGDNTNPFELNNGEYSNIEDLINLFDKDTLDIFESEFIRFCEKSSISDLGELRPNTRLHKIMEKLFIVDKPSNEENTNTFFKELSKNQESTFNSFHKNKLFNQEKLFKYGNPGNFDRRIFKSFSNDQQIQPTQKIIYGNYGDNLVPGFGTTLNQSISDNADAWRAVYLNFGEPQGENVKYEDSGSLITNFFPLFNIDFNEDNVNMLSPLIRIYVGKKLKDNNYDVNDFYGDLNEFIVKQNDLHKDILNHLFIKLNNKLPDVSRNIEEISFSNVDGADIAKVDIWETFRMMNDKWVSGQDFKERTLFEDFLFLDRANRPVGDKVIVNIEKIRKKLKNRSDSLTVYQLVSDIMTDNGFTFMPTPVYTNFYGRHDRVKEGEPIPQDIPNDMFGTFMEVDVRESRPRMLGIYVGEPSKNLKMNKNPNSRRLDDAFDLVRASDCPLIENTTDKKDFSDSNKCVGFNVDFGTRNQGIFKSISLDMSQHKNIAPTFQVLADMGSYASQQKVAQQSQSLYNFYKSQSYNCTISSMGNAMIQPTMYFNLRHVPMFTGPYLIINVSHDISARDFTTQFEGIRIPKHALEVPDKLVMSVNKELLKSFQEKIKRENVNNGKTLTEGDTVKGNDTNKNASEEKCKDITNYPDIQFNPTIEMTITKNILLNKIDSKGFSNNMTYYLYCLPFLYNNITENGDIEFNNYNLYNIHTSGENNFNITNANESLINGQMCFDSTNNEGVSGSYSVASFKDINDLLEFMRIRYQPLSPILNDIVDVRATVNNEEGEPYSNDTIAEGLCFFLYNTMGIVDGNNAITINTNMEAKLIPNSNFKENYEKTKNLFKNTLSSIV